MISNSVLVFNLINNEPPKRKRKKQGSDNFRIGIYAFPSYLSTSIGITNIDHIPLTGMASFYTIEVYNLARKSWPACIPAWPASIPAKFSVLGLFLWLIFGKNLSTVAYKAVAYKKNRVIMKIRR